MIDANKYNINFIPYEEWKQNIINEESNICYYCEGDVIKCNNCDDGYKEEYVPCHENDLCEKRQGFDTCDIDCYQGNFNRILLCDVCMGNNEIECSVCNGISHSISFSSYTKQMEQDKQKYISHMEEINKLKTKVTNI